ncbi:hypothetical protein D3C85_1030240 [compost metagenome]
MLDQHVFLCYNTTKLQFELFRIHQICDTNPVTSSFIHISRADPFARRTNFAIAFTILFQTVKHQVIRHNDMRAVTDVQVRCRKTIIMNVINFFNECSRINNHPIPDHTSFIFVKNTGRNHRQLVLFPANNDRMACIVTTLITCNNLSRFR